MAEAYNHLPSREMLQAAAHLEQARMQRSAQTEQLTVQKASLAVAVLSQIPRDNEENKPIFAAARELLLESVKEALAELRERRAEKAKEAEDEEREELRDGGAL